MSDTEQQVPEAKRVKLDTADSNDEEIVTRMTESRAGISAYIDPTLPGFQGIIKQRFTDFMVNEIDLSGNVCRLNSLDPPPGKYLAQLRPEAASSPTEAAPSEQDKATPEAKAQIDLDAWPAEALEKLKAFFAQDKLEALKEMWSQGKIGENMATGANATIVSAASITTRPLESKEERTQVHKLVRELFHGKLATDSITLRSWVPKQPMQDDEDARANGASTSSAPATAIAIRWANKSDRRKGEPLSEEASSSPPYIHFLLQKTNRDHQEAMILLAESLRLGGGGGGRGGRARGRGRGGSGRGGGRPLTKDLGIAGTKDKRAVTVQRVSLKRNKKTLEDVYRLINGITADVDPAAVNGTGKGKGKGRTVLDVVSNRSDRGIRIGHLCYAHQPLKLGQLRGNEFTITLRNVGPRASSSLSRADFVASVQASMNVLRDRGFINYFGMQRFGTGAVPTHHMGILILKDDFKGAIDLLFEPRIASSPTSDDGDSPEILKAKQLFQKGEYDKAYHEMPRHCVAEKHILDRMRGGRWIQGDWTGAFSNVPRTLRLMYLHAYQSYVWNRLVSERIERFGSTDAVVGDLVFADDDGEGGWEAEPEGGVDGAERDKDDDDDEDDDDEDDLRNSGPQKSCVATWRRRVKVLTADDVGKHTIYDVIVPLPGASIDVPSGWMDTLYTAILSSDGLVHEQLTSSRIPEYQLKGSYRQMLVKPRHFNYHITCYTDPDKPLTFTDEEKCLNLHSPTPTDPHGPFTALSLTFQLPTASYATMLMREALKHDTSSFIHRQLTLNSHDQKFRTRPRPTPSF